jgi:hypothetical protein
MSNYPLHKWENSPVTGSSMNRTWAMQSMAVTAFHSAAPALYVS